MSPTPWFTVDDDAKYIDCSSRCEMTSLTSHTINPKSKLSLNDTILNIKAIFHKTETKI